MSPGIRRPYPSLRAWRQAMGYNQHQAANLLGLSQSFYSKLEREENRVPGPVAKRIVELTGVPLEVIVGAA